MFHHVIVNKLIRLHESGVFKGVGSPLEREKGWKKHWDEGGVDGRLKFVALDFSAD